MQTAGKFITPLVMDNYPTTVRRVRSCLRNGDAGQALVEYLLILVVSVAIITGLLLSFNKAFRKYMELSGDYFGCLLDLGELPTLSGSDGTRGNCAAPTFSFNAPSGGSSASSSNGSGGGNKGDSGKGSGKSSSSSSTSSSSSSDANSESNKKSRKSDAAKENASRGADGGAGSDAGGAGSAGRANRNSTGRPRLQSAGGGSGNSKSAGEDPAKLTANYSAANVSSGRSGRDGHAIAFYTFPDDQSVEGKSSPGGRVSLGKQEANSRGRSTRTSLEPPKRKVASTDDEQGSFDWGDLLKYIVIAIIAIMILVLVGGQLLTAAKSLEKE